MSKKYIRALAGMLAAMLLPTPVLAHNDTAESVALSLKEATTVNETIPTTITVDDTQIRRTIDDHMLGIQYEMSSDEDTILKSGTTTFQDDFAEFADTLYEVPIMRLGGAAIENTNLWNTVGPMSARKASYNVLTGTAGEPAKNFGVVEWIKQGLMINPDVQFIPCISMTHATPEDNAKLAQFLLDDKDESIYGQMRASYGLEEPVKVLAFELGNEIDWEPPYTWEVTEKKLPWYKEVAKANIEAISAVCPEATFMLCGKTAPDLDADEWRTWTIELLELFKDNPNVKYMAFHQYYAGYRLAYTHAQYREKLYEDIYSVLGEDTDFKIVYTEHATWFREEGDSRMVSLYAALSTGEFFNRMLGYESTMNAGATYHAYTGGGNWWSIFKRIDGKYYKMGNALIMEFYQRNLGDRVLTAMMESDSDYTDMTSNGCRLSVLATPKDDHTLNLILVNETEDVEFDIDFTFLKNKYTLVSEEVFTAPNLESYVGSEQTKDVFRTTVTEKNESNFSHYKMPTKSAVCLTLETTATLPSADGTSGTTEGEVVYEGDNKFTDIDYSPARSEINLLAESGMVAGTEPGKFAPKKEMTRAELATMLVNAFGIDTTEELNMVFADVDKNDWFYTPVAHAYAEGFVRGSTDGNFYPNHSMTMEEFLTVAARVLVKNSADWESIDADRILAEAGLTEQVSAWAKQSVAYAIHAGLADKFLIGLDLNGTVTREMAAIVIYKLHTLRG